MKNIIKKSRGWTAFPLSSGLCYSANLQRVCVVQKQISRRHKNKKKTHFIFTTESITILIRQDFKRIQHITWLCSKSKSVILSVKIFSNIQVQRRVGCNRPELNEKRLTHKKVEKTIDTLKRDAIEGQVKLGMTHLFFFFLFLSFLQILFEYKSDQILF